MPPKSTPTSALEGFLGDLDLAGVAAKAANITSGSLRQVGQTNKQAHKQTPKQDGTRPDKHPSRHTSSQSIEQSIEHPSEQSVGHSLGQSTMEISEDNPAGWLSDKHVQVAWHIFNNRHLVLGYRGMSAALGIPYGTLRTVIAQLREFRFVAGVKRFNRGRQRGLVYLVNEERCRHLFQVRFGADSYPDIQLSSHPNIHQGSQSSRQSINHTNSHHLEEDKDSSSSYFEKLTLEALGDPELTYWRSQGFGIGHIRQIQQQWPTKAAAEIITDLKHARWHLVIEGCQLNRGTPLDYLMGAFRRSGAYSRRPGYKSPEQIEIEALEQALAEKKKQREKIGELTAVRNRLEHLPTDFEELYREKGEHYRKMMEWIEKHDPDGHKYLQGEEPGGAKHRTVMETYFSQYTCPNSKGDQK